MIFLALVAWLIAVAFVALGFTLLLVSWHDGLWDRSVAIFLNILTCGMFVFINVMLYQDFIYTP